MCRKNSCIVNHLIGLGKIFQREELNIKILKGLDRSWQPKVTTIFESKDLTTLTTASLLGKLREHELEMNRLNDQVKGEKHVENNALKAVLEDSQLTALIVRLSTCSQGNLASSWRRKAGTKVSHQTGTIARM